MKKKSDYPEKDKIVFKWIVNLGFDYRVNSQILRSMFNYS
jgi:hypothetical protein